MKRHQSSFHAANQFHSRIEPHSNLLIFILVLAAVVPASFAQVTFDTKNPSLNSSSAAPLTITLQDALQRARQNDPQYRSAVTDLGLAREDRVQARAGLLPGVNYNNSFIYTQGTGPLPDRCVATPGICTPSRFVANNGVHEYISQADVHEALSLTNVADFRRSSAALAQARAKAEIARRGLVVTVTQSYYGLVVAERKYSTAQKADAEAARFLDVSQKLEHGGEVAHADVVKAQIQAQQQRRDLREAQLGMEKSRLDLAVMLFPDFNQNFAVVDDLQTLEPLPSFPEIEAAGKKNNPDLRAALAALQVAKHEVTAAWGGLLPSLSVDYFYGIDSNVFAIRNNGVRNLGYSGVASLQIPIFSWGARSQQAQASGTTPRPGARQTDLRATGIAESLAAVLQRSGSLTLGDGIFGEFRRTGRRQYAADHLALSGRGIHCIGGGRRAKYSNLGPQCLRRRPGAFPYSRGQPPNSDRNF